MFKKLIKKLMDYLSKISVEQEDLVGVDITPSCIRLAQLEDGDDKWTLTKLGYKYLEDVSASDPVKEDADQYINKLSQIITSSGIQTTNAAVSIPVSSAIIKVVTLPLMSDEELQEAVDTNTLWENAIQLSDDLEEYSVFWQVLNRNTSENQMDLLFVASKLDDIDHYLNIVRQAGLNPVIVDVRCFAIRNALELRKDLTKSDKPIAIVEFGAYENYILILHQDSPFISDIYISDKDCNLLLSQDSDKELLKGVGQRFAMQISQMLSTYQSKYKIQPIESLLISSSIPVINTMVENIEESLSGIKIEVFNALKNIVIPENLKEKSSAEPNDSVFSAVLGLATRKLDVFGYYEYVTGTNNINLLPDREGVKNQEKMKFLSRWGIIIFIIIAIITGAWSFFSATSDNEEISMKVREYDELSTKMQEKKATLSDLIIKKDELSGRLKASESIVSNQSFMYSVLVAINSSVPQGVSFSEINYTGDKTLIITGLSFSHLNISNFVDKLSSTKVISKSELLNMAEKTVNKRVFKSFSIKCTLANQQPVDKKEKSNGN